MCVRCGGGGERGGLSAACLYTYGEREREREREGERERERERERKEWLCNGALMLTAAVLVHSGTCQNCRHCGRRSVCFGVVSAGQAPPSLCALCVCVYCVCVHSVCVCVYCVCVCVYCV